MLYSYYIISYIYLQFTCTISCLVQHDTYHYNNTYYYYVHHAKYLKYYSYIQYYIYMINVVVLTLYIIL